MILKHSQKDWDIHFLAIAKLCSKKSKDPSTKVGAVIVSKDNKIISTGYNGFPKDIIDYKDWYTDREIKYSKIIHAEQNALINKGLNEITEGSSIYVYPLKPCEKCYNELKEHGIKRFVSVQHDSSKEDYCNVCSKTKKDCSNNRWDQTSYYKEDDEILLLNYEEVKEYYQN